MQMFQLLPVDLPAVLDPGEYLFRDGRRIVLALELLKPLPSRELANLLEQVESAAA